MDNIPICGPKLSICCTLLSVWGVIMLAFMGLFLRLKSPAFIEDLPIDEAKWIELDYSEDYVYEKYDQASTNCFIASGLYVAVFGISAICWHINNRRNYSMS